MRVDSHEAAGVGNRTSAIRQLAIRSARRADATQREDRKKFEAQIRRRPPAAAAMAHPRRPEIVARSQQPNSIVHVEVSI